MCDKNNSSGIGLTQLEEQSDSPQWVRPREKAWEEDQELVFEPGA